MIINRLFSYPGAVDSFRWHLFWNVSFPQGRNWIIWLHKTKRVQLCMTDLCLCLQIIFLSNVLIRSWDVDVRPEYLHTYFIVMLWPLSKLGYMVGVDRLSAPILSILPIIDIGHFQNIFADNFFLYFFFIIYIFFYNANKHTIYRWHYLLVNK